MLLLLNAKFLGTTGIGRISLAILVVAFYQLIMGFMTGSITYWIPRRSTGKLFITAFTGIILSLVIATPVFYTIGLFPDQIILWPIILAFLHGVNELFQNILVGQNNLRQFNRVLFIIHSVIIASVLVGFTQMGWQTVIWVLQAMSLGYLVGVAYNFFYLLPHLFHFKNDENSFLNTFKTLFHHGAYVQLSNLFQKINYRLTYYFVEAAAGIEMLGLYAAGIQLSEGVFNLSRSFSVVEYGEIANTNNAEQHKQTVHRFLKLSFWGSLVLLSLLLVVPEFVYVKFLGSDFTGVKEVIYWLSPGVLFFSINTILAHYFTGIGSFKMNLKATIIGVPLTILGCFLLIKPYGLAGAATTQNMAYAATLIFLFINYKSKIKNK